MLADSGRQEVRPCDFLWIYESFSRYTKMALKVD